MREIFPTKGIAVPEIITLDSTRVEPSVGFRWNRMITSDRSGFRCDRRMAIKTSLRPPMLYPVHVHILPPMLCAALRPLDLYLQCRVLLSDRSPRSPSSSRASELRLNHVFPPCILVCPRGLKWFQLGTTVARLQTHTSDHGLGRGEGQRIGNVSKTVWMVHFG